MHILTEYPGLRIQAEFQMRDSVPFSANLEDQGVKVGTVEGSWRYWT
jgi:hypothetical protein